MLAIFHELPPATNQRADGKVQMQETGMDGSPPFSLIKSLFLFIHAQRKDNQQEWCLPSIRRCWWWRARNLSGYKFIPIRIQMFTVVVWQEILWNFRRLFLGTDRWQICQKQQSVSTRRDCCVPVRSINLYFRPSNTAWATCWYGRSMR